MDAAALRAMRPTAVLINIGRGPLVVQADLIAALTAGTIAGAGLDVNDPEPLPADSPLWHLPNFLITRHVAGSNPHYNERATALFCDNLRRDLPVSPYVTRWTRRGAIDGGLGVGGWGLVLRCVQNTNPQPLTPNP